MSKTIRVTILHPAKKTTRKLSLEEFTTLAKKIELPPFDTLRFLGKTANFALLFSAGARTFADSSLTALSPEEAENMVEQLNLRAIQKKIISDGKLSGEEMRDQYLLARLALATYIRNEFRKAYKGLVELADRRRGEAVSKGYVRCTHGAVRRLPEMLLQGKHNQGDRELYTLFSIAINSPVQNFESVIVTWSSAYRLWEWLIENDMKSYIFNLVHDSLDIYIHKDEAHQVVAKVKELAEERRSEFEGVIPTVSGTLGDYYGEGHLWKEGYPMGDFL